VAGGSLGNATSAASATRFAKILKPATKHPVMPLVVRLRRSSWRADMYEITYPDAERAKGLAAGSPGNSQAGTMLIADDRQVRPERRYGLQGAGPQLSGAEQVGDPGHASGGVGDDPGDQIAVAAAGQDGAARVGQQFWPK
jgi:hypothetical protein